MRLPLAVVLAAVCVAGCGSSSSSSSSSPTQPKPPAGGPAPASLVGVYKTQLTKSDLAGNRAPELQVAPGWKLTIRRRSLTLTNATAGELESPQIAVSGDTIVLKQEECAAGGTTHFYDNVYRFSQSGKTLRFTKVRNSCADRVAETILTSEPWTRQGG